MSVAYTTCNLVLAPFYGLSGDRPFLPQKRMLILYVGIILPHFDFVKGVFENL